MTEMSLWVSRQYEIRECGQTSATAVLVYLKGISTRTFPNPRVAQSSEISDHAKLCPEFCLFSVRYATNAIAFEYIKKK